MKQNDLHKEEKAKPNNGEESKAVTVGESDGRTKLEFIHQLGRALFKGQKDDGVKNSQTVKATFDLAKITPIFKSEDYKGAKQKILPKHYSEDFNLRLLKWNDYIASWVKELVPCALLEILNGFFAEDLDLASELDQNLNKIQASLDELNRNLSTKISSDSFNTSNTNEICTAFHNFIQVYLNSIYAHQNEQLRLQYNSEFIFMCEGVIPCIAQKESVDKDIYWNDSEETIKNELRDIILGVAMDELGHYLLTHNPTTINNNGCIFARISKTKLGKTWFLPSIYNDNSLETMFMNNLLANVGKNWREVILGDENLKAQIFQAKFNQVKIRLKKVMDSVSDLSLHFTWPTDKVNISAIFLEAPQNIKLPQFSQIQNRKLQKVFFCLYNKLPINNGLFLYDYLLEKHKQDGLQKIIDESISRFIDALFKKRDKEFVFHHIALPNDQEIRQEMLEKLKMRQTESYITFLAANFTFPQIKSTSDWIISMKLSERSLRRCYKSFFYTVFFKPRLSTKELDVITQRNELIKHSQSVVTYKSGENKKGTALYDCEFICGDQFCFNYPLKTFGVSSIRYDLTVHGVINPYLVTLPSYEKIDKRLSLISTKLPNINAKQKMVEWICCTLAVDSKPIINDPDIPLDMQGILLQFLCDTVMCSFMIESVRNNGTLAVNPLQLRTFYNNDSFQFTLFPMAIEESAKQGRSLQKSHGTREGVDNTILSGSDDGNSIKLREKEISCIDNHKNLSFNELAIFIHSFWHKPLETLKENQENSEKKSPKV